MDLTIDIAGLVALAATLMVVTRRDAVHALLYLVVSLLAVAVVFYALGAPFAAALEVIIYAGAIVVLFVFVVMMLNVGRPGRGRPSRAGPMAWAGPALLSAILLGELCWMLAAGAGPAAAGATVGPTQVGELLFGPYLLAVELASMLLLAGLVGAHHVGDRVDEEGGLSPRAGRETQPAPTRFPAEAPR